jgi:hypothetical protein
MSGMSKKHFIAIAKAFNKRVTFIRENEQLDGYAKNAGETILAVLADDLAITFKELNPEFRKETFMEACGFK